jgi:hypothetical protein
VRRREPPAPPAGVMPPELVVFRVEDWCDPAATPPDWYMAALDGRVYWSLAAEATVEGYWYAHARMAHMRAVAAWHREHGHEPVGALPPERRPADPGPVGGPI